MNNGKYIVEVSNKNNNIGNFDEKSFSNELIKSMNVFDENELKISAVIAGNIKKDSDNILDN